MCAQHHHPERELKEKHVKHCWAIFLHARTMISTVQYCNTSMNTEHNNAIALKGLVGKGCTS